MRSLVVMAGWLHLCTVAQFVIHHSMPHHHVIYCGYTGQRRRLVCFKCAYNGEVLAIPLPKILNHSLQNKQYRDPHTHTYTWVITAALQSCTCTLLRKDTLPPYPPTCSGQKQPARNRPETKRQKINSDHQQQVVVAQLLCSSCEPLLRSSPCCRVTMQNVCRKTSRKKCKT